MGLGDSLSIAAAGMRAQGDRLRVISENVANANSTSTTPGGEPYRRKVVFFQSVLDKEMGIKQVKVVRRSNDPSPFNRRYEANLNMVEVAKSMLSQTLALLK